MAIFGVQYSENDRVTSVLYMSLEFEGISLIWNSVVINSVDVRMIFSGGSK